MKTKYEVTYQKPHGSRWSVHNVFDRYYEIFSKKYNTEYITPVNTSEPAGPHSPHLMTIRNIDTRKYVVVSYWDRANELLIPALGWDTENLVTIITSAGVHTPNEIFTPFSYGCYTTEFDDLHLNRKKVKDKQNSNLEFRGYLYAERHSLAETGKLNILSQKIHPNTEYYESLNNNKICLSLNGAGEICNRDIEILSSGSVLFRPELKQKFHNELIPDYHYLTFDTHSDPNTQADIILDKFESIKNNKRLLNKISNNGYEWFKKNGTVSSNVNLLKKIINKELLEKLK
jgi:hypothetical protein